MATLARAGVVDEINAGIKAGSPDEVIRLYPSAIFSGKLSTRNLAIAYHDRGNAWQAKQDYDRAIADYTEVIR